MAHNEDIVSSGKQTAKNTEEIAHVTDDEAINIETLSEQSLKRGKQWIFRETFTLADQENLQILIEMPDSAEDVARVMSRSFISTDGFQGSLSLNVDYSSAGSDVRYANTRVEDPVGGNPTVNVTTDGTYDKTAGVENALPVAIFTGAEGVQRSPINASVASFRLRPGANILYDLTSQAADNNVEIEFVLSERSIITE